MKLAASTFIELIIALVIIMISSIMVITTFTITMINLPNFNSIESVILLNNYIYSRELVDYPKHLNIHLTQISVINESYNILQIENVSIVNSNHIVMYSQNNIK